MRLTKRSTATAAEVNARFHLLTSHDILRSEVTWSAPVIKSSSKTNGMATASANGHPTIAPLANASVANSVRRVFPIVGRCSAYAKPRVFACIAKDEGRNAIEFALIHYYQAGCKDIPVAAFHIPALNNSMKKT